MLLNEREKNMAKGVSNSFYLLIKIHRGEKNIQQIGIPPSPKKRPHCDIKKLKKFSLNPFACLL
jgi:hypothetical protein